MTDLRSSKNIILYADDDPDDLELVQEAFMRYARNVEVMTAKNGSQALSLLEELQAQEASPCLIILDVNMPLLDGKEALKRIRQMNMFQSTPVVLFTTSSQPSDQHFASKYNAGFITKPLDITQMEMIAELFIDHCTEEIKKNIRRHFQ